MPFSYTLETFITKSRTFHGDYYDYSKVNYVNAGTKVDIICPVHGSFFITPHAHLQKQGCGKCAYDLKRKSKESFVERANIKHNNKYTYDKLAYVSTNLKGIITCPVHGDFEQNLSNHLNGNGCMKCMRESRRHTLDSFIKAANKKHRGKYDYSKTVYTVAHDEVTITCPKHGDFTQLAYAHLQGKGCMTCSESQGEKMVAKILDDIGVKYERQYVHPDCKHINVLRFDFKAGDTLIEYQGLQHYEVGNFTKDDDYNQRLFERCKKVDRIKRKFCKLNNISLIEVPYVMKENEVKDLLTKKLNPLH